MPYLIASTLFVVSRQIINLKKSAFDSSRLATASRFVCTVTNNNNDNKTNKAVPIEIGKEIAIFAHVIRHKHSEIDSIKTMSFFLSGAIFYVNTSALSPIHSLRVRLSADDLKCVCVCVRFEYRAQRLSRFDSLLVDCVTRNLHGSSGAE